MYEEVIKKTDDHVGKFYLAYKPIRALRTFYSCHQTEASYCSCFREYETPIL